MNKTFITSCMLLAACGGVQVQTDTITPLEQLCVRDPLNADNWERLAAALVVAGERERAATMYLQAASLRAHDVRQDYAVLKQARDEAVADMPCTQVRRLGPALVEVLRSDAADQTVTPTAPAAVRLEISNGNGISGAAARLARSLALDGLQTVRLSNMPPFVVPRSRIEYVRGQRVTAQALAWRLHMPLQQASGGTPYADIRIVLGHDVRHLK
ncbi:hypothetical protein GTP38_02190 [Duganella sp. FT94W]|uniref:LytR/CpsA/Psr regulator C-terminal domain-containing protein n=1 Tax=Duganella lactea TaxID=2692173 RepID=A0ABW9V2Y9_9BURK|nr:LytR C-terminal domain-containing protein [Duganella lactea]MYM33157.1 hypothetical protein [Duganella lactea]